MLVTFWRQDIQEAMHCNTQNVLYGVSAPGQVYQVTILCWSSQITRHIRMSTAAPFSSPHMI